ncbi:hypothetical protein TNCV_3498451 [Trichonephila clavipes]|nr:hypothetical protein TNCV_3498451 [Trichonephila clavipes]
MEAKRNLCDVFGKEAVATRTCQRWLVKLRTHRQQHAPKLLDPPKKTSPRLFRSLFFVSFFSPSFLGAFGEIFGHMAREASLHPISGIVDVER